jgi:hypothetical protein
MLSVTALVLAGLGQRSADATHMTVTEVQGSAENCRGSISFFGGPPQVTQPTASVELPPGGSATPITASDGCLVRIQFPTGPGPILLSAASVAVSTQGTTGPTGSVTSTATATDVGTDENEALQATSISAECVASESGVSGSTTVTNGTVVTDQNANTVEAVPENPEPGFSIEGVNGAGDRYRYVFNEQIVNADGSLTVNAVHLELLGPNATGDVILGQVVCGVTTVAQETTTTVPEETTTTTVPEETTTTTVPEETTTTTVPEETTTTTVPEETTTTTVPEETTTTTVPEETTTTTVPEETTTTTVPEETTTTTVPEETTTTTVPEETTTTTTVGAACVPFQDNNARPGYGYGDVNHRHCGPPGQTGDRPPGAPDRGVDGRRASSSRNLTPAWLLAGLGVLFLAPLVVPFGRSRRDDHRA